MNQEDREAVNAALLLEERITDRILEVLEDNPQTVLRIVGLALAQNPTAALQLYKFIEPHMPAPIRQYVADSYASQHINPLYRI